MINKKALGSFIQKGRKAKGLRQDQVSAKTSLSRNYISDIENGRYTPSVEALSRLAIVLKLDLNVIKMTEIQVGDEYGDT
ncbi:helix-turn-helix domain-containing protein [Paenibacillus sp. NPDC055715]